MNRVLVVDDEPAIGWSLREVLVDEGYEVVVAADVATATRACRDTPPDAILLDVRLGRDDGLAALPRLRKHSSAPVVVMTAFGDLDTAVRAVEAGAFDYLVKPFDLERVTQVVAAAVAEADLPKPAVAPPGGVTLVGTTPAMQEVFKRIALVASSDLPVLITGATGTGKELAARAIHEHGPRRDRPFVATDLAALAPAAIERELFGSGDVAGLFEMADGGTLFLDEITAAPIDVQAKLARSLEAGTVFRGGSVAARTVAVRVIAATSRDLDAALASGGFRSDLAQRLAAFPITMPPLAERTTDIGPLATAFLARHAAGRRVPAVTPEFIAALENRPWPGNVRELRAAVEHAALRARGGALRPEHLPPAAGPAVGGSLATAEAGMGDAVREWAAAARAAFGDLAEPDLHHRGVKLLEATLLREALAHTGGNRTAAARLLGLDRATLRAKLRGLGLDD